MKAIIYKVGIYKVNPNRFNTPDSSWHSMKFSFVINSCAAHQAISEHFKMCFSFFTNTAVQLAAWAAFNNVDIDNPLAPNGLPLRDWVCGSSAGSAIPNFEGNEIYRSIQKLFGGHVEKNHNNVISREKLIVFCS